jgi:gluconolactonase
MMVVKSEDLLELIDESASVERIATGFRFTEGPIWNADGGYLLFSDMPGDVRRRWSATDGVAEVMNPANKCNGMVYDAEGRLVVCEHATSTLLRESADGTRETLATHFRGKELNSPNDVITRSDGTIYFTDPWYGRMAGDGVGRERELGFQGVYRIPPGGELELVVGEHDFEMPNGLCLSPDESLLYIDDTPNACIRVYDVAADGSLSNGRLFLGDIGDGVVGADGVVDGMKCDERGNVWVSGPGGVWVISPAGEHLGVVEAPEIVANLAWGGAGWRTLFLTATTSLYRIETKVASARLPYH